MILAEQLLPEDREGPKYAYNVFSQTSRKKKQKIKIKTSRRILY